MRTVKDLNYKLKVHILIQFQKRSFPLLLLFYYFEHMSIFSVHCQKGHVVNRILSETLGHSQRAS